MEKNSGEAKMSDLGWTIESIGYNKDKSAYIAKASAGAAGTLAVTNALAIRNKERKAENLQLIVVLYLIAGFAVGTWGYIKQSIIWLAATKQNKVNFTAALAHLLIPPLALCFPAFCAWLAIKNNWIPHGSDMTMLGLIGIPLVSLIFTFLAAYLSLSFVNKRSSVDDFIGIGAAFFQSISCFLVYGAIAVLVLNQYIDDVFPTSIDKHSISQKKKSTNVNPINASVQNSKQNTEPTEALAKTNDASKVVQISETSQTNQPEVETTTITGYRVCNLDPNGENFLSLKAEPNGSSARVLKMTDGTTLTLLDKNGEWYQVQMTNGKTGWANNKWLCQVNGQLSSAAEKVPFSTSKNQSIAPSFNCQNASTKTEKMICSSEELSKLDAQLAELYKTALSVDPDKELLKQYQNSWRKNTRDACTLDSCVKTAYQNRIAELIHFK
jgi:uncharacterized protein YecT (DUF1311 family)